MRRTSNQTGERKSDVFEKKPTNLSPYEKQADNSPVELKSWLRGRCANDTVGTNLAALAQAWIPASSEALNP